MSHLPILIVGAGPTGLMMAAECLRYGIPFRIIDKKAEPTQGSNATVMHTRTLEIFDAIGILDQFLRFGHQCEAVNLYVKGKPLITIPFTQTDSTYPFMLTLPQRETERILTKKITDANCHIERSLALITLQQTHEGVVSTLQHADGTTETVTSQWLIACDGANSTVRNVCEIPFPGEDISEQFMVADAQMSSFLPNNEFHIFFDEATIFPDKATMFAAFPWGTDQYRLTANLYSSSPRQTFTEHEVKEIVAERTYGHYVVDAVSWISPFWIHGKIVKQMRHDAIFLAGDAAHIHSPAGGQGMNTGIQDAYNLAWKLALVINGNAKASLLDSYQAERYPIVSNIVTQTELFTKMALFDKHFLNKLEKFSHEVAGHPELAKKIVNELSQINIQYKKSPIIDYQEIPSDLAPEPGTRAKDAKDDNGKTLYHYLQNTKHNVLVFISLTSTKTDLTKMVELKQLVDTKFVDTVKLFIVSSNPLLTIENVIPDTQNTIHNEYLVQHTAIYIIRPDTYIAYSAQKIDLASIERFLIAYLL